MSRARLSLVLVALLLPACGAAAHRFANGIAGELATPSGSQPPSRERTLNMPDYQDCNGNALDGRETDVKTSDAHCGACGHACDSGHCERGICEGPSAVGTLPSRPGAAETPPRRPLVDPPDYQDCNHNALDGRETDVKTSDTHCGACGHACDGGRCEHGVCAPR